MKLKITIELLAYVVFYSNICVTVGKVDIFLTKDEVHRIIGLEAQVDYVQDGEVLPYPFQFNVLVPRNVTELYFHWKRNTEAPIYYSLAIGTSRPDVLKPLATSVQPTGEIPTELKTFGVRIECNGLITSNVDVQIYLNYTFPSRENATKLVWKRNKYCIMEKPGFDENNYANPEPVGDNISAKTVDGSSSSGISKNAENTNAYVGVTVTPTNVFYIAVGGICGFVILTTAMLIAYFLRIRKPEDQKSYLVTVSTHAPSSQSQPFLQPSSPSNNSKYSACTTGRSSARTASKHYSPVPSIMFADTTRKIDTAACARELAVARATVSLTTLVQEGTFGEVFVGFIESTVEPYPVMVKTLKSHATQTQTDMFLREGFSFTGAPQHDNVLQVVAAVVDASFGVPPMLCYRRPQNGNLKQFLLGCHGTGMGTGHPLSTQDLVYISLQVVSGMMHLHRYHIVHKDLAARNCVIDDNLLVQVGDCALARDLFPGDYCCIGDNENRPIKWLAFEALVERQFSTASDVWAFGVLLWELATVGQTPYADIDPFEMADFLRSGERLPQPYNCPDEFYGVAFCCWSLSSEARPTFARLQTALNDFYSALLQFV